METVVRIRSLSHRYGATLALDHIDLEIPASRMVGLIGPDGVGKSSLLALAAGVRKVQGGTVEVLANNMRDKHQRTAVCSRIAYMPQGLGHNLYMTLSVRENLDFFARLFGQAQHERTMRIDELLSGTGLSRFAERPAGKLSGGMKQKLGLCCALIHDPDLLILDEPTTGVDPLSRRQFWELIERLKTRQHKMSVIASTAYMDEAQRFDWLVAMDSGRVLDKGTPEELRTRTGTDSLEDAFVALLPADKRRGHRKLIVPARTSADNESAIEARHLSRRFGDFTAVDDVSFRIQRGEIFGFLGSNGCGKTTTMKMLTGLLPASEGDAFLFGHRVDARDVETRKRVGYMSQSFSLYTELTVRQNLALHARIFHLPWSCIPARIEEMLHRFGLQDAADELAERLPLGMRQRLSLAVAAIHGPDMLILDEPTSGVDPVARDQFWELLVRLSREDGVTIFISTHFMNEAERCDRISLMHSGKVLAHGPPGELVAALGSDTLEQAFIRCLKEAEPDSAPAANVRPMVGASHETLNNSPPAHFDLGRAWAYARREGMEIRRDPIRLAFAILGPIILMIAFGYGITFDVEDLSYAALDHDQSPASRRYLKNLSSSPYFEERRQLKDHLELDRRMRKGELSFAIEIPPAFGRDLKRQRRAQVGLWLDGTNPQRAETARSYVHGIHEFYLTELTQSTRAPPRSPLVIETRFRYNQDFKSVFAMVPGTITMLLVWIPAMMTAAGVVREKEMGSITNLYATPVSGLEFLLGKQLPYLVIAVINFVIFLALATLLFQVPIKGSVAALCFGAVLYVSATTGVGLLISSFMKTQIAAIFGTAIISVVPAVNFSGLFVPTSSLTENARVIGEIFPSSYFQQISLGTFTKALGFAELSTSFLMLTVLILVYLSLALLLLRTQER